MANPKIILDGDATGAVAAVKRLSKELGSLEGLAAKAFNFAVAGYSIASVVDLAKSVVELGDGLNKMSQKTGIAVEDLSKLQYAADLSNVSNEALQKGLTAMAVGMAEVATGAGPLADEYKKLGIRVRNEDGTMKSSGAVLAELADKFQLMPDGIEKTNLAVTIFGKKMGADMIPLLNSGSAGLKAMGDEAQKLGLVMSADLAKKSEEFNDNMERLSKLSRELGINIASALIPGLNQFIGQIIDAKKASLGWLEALVEIGLTNPFKKTADQIADIDKKLTELRKSGSGLSQKLSADFSSSAGTSKQIEALEKLRKYYQLQQERENGDALATAEQNAAKRVIIESQLQAKLAELAKLRGIAEGKVSADILLADDKRTAAQIKNAQALRDALSVAWKQSIDDAKAAGEAAKKAFESASDIRQNANDKATSKERSTMSPEDQQYLLQKDYRAAADAASNSASLAQLAAQHGRTENAAKLAAQAAKDAERAAKLADQITDPNESAKAIREAGEIAAKLEEAKGTAKLKEQKDLEERATQQAGLIADLDKQLTDLQAKAAAIQVQADISAAQGAIATLQTQLDALQDKTITVTVNTTSTPIDGQSVPMAPGGGFARGGYTGPGGKWQPAGIVHAGEFVHRQEVVRQPGALAFLARFNQIGMAALKRNGYAAGGLVNNLSIPSIAPQAGRESSSGTPITLVLDGQRVPVTAASDVAQQLKTMFAREALKKGGRR